MTAQEIIKTLGGRWHGSHGMACCPAHEDRSPSLSIRDGDGKLLTHCHAGCPPEAVWAALQDRSLVKQADDRPRERRQRHGKPISEPSPNQDHALEIWRASQPATGTPVESYLRHRGITIPVPPSLRYNPATKYTPSGLSLPAMIAGIQSPARRIVAVHRTYLRLDGRGKAGVSTPKMALGPLSSGAVRLGPAGAVLSLAEGVETGLSAMQLFDVPVWCSLSASRLDRLWLPSESLEIHIFADNGGPGIEAAERATKAYQAQGRRVVVRLPSASYDDWNDALRAEVTA